MGKKHGTDGILCRQVSVPGYGAWILPSERVPVPGYCAQVFVWAPLKCYVHICAHAQALNPVTKSGRGLSLSLRQKAHVNLMFVPSFSEMTLQLLHFHTVFKTWLTFQELTSIVSLRRKCWSQSNLSKNRNVRGNQSKDICLVRYKN